MRYLFLAFFLIGGLVAADPDMELVQLAKTAPDDAPFQTAVRRILKDGRGVTGYMGEFVFVAQAPSAPQLLINDKPGPPMKQVKGDDNLWMATAKLPTGVSHNYSLTIDGKALPPVDFSAFGEGSYEKPGVPQGKLSEKIVHTSKIYDGMTTNYWIYAPAQYDASRAAALMVVQDGEKYARRDSPTHLLPAIDNMIHEKRMPVTIVVMISPGTVGEKRMRSIQYDSVDDVYPRFLRDEILKDVESKYNIRKDAYSRSIMGESSGAICAFNAAWFHTDHFSRVISRIGTYTSIQWKPGQKDGGNIYPFWVRKSDRKNIRVWLQDGSNDLENTHGSWPLQNIQMANSLKMKEYDFKFTWGNAQHNTRHGDAQMPEALIWLWRGYDPSKTSETYTMDPAEKSKPYWRVTSLNRD